MNKFRFVFILLCFYLVISSVKSNALMVEIPLEKLTFDADLIVLGYVENVESKMNKEKISGFDSIHSFATISIEKVIKGHLAHPKVLVKFLEGTVGSKRLYIEDSPNYQVSERVLVFLKKAVAGDYYQTVGMFQGKFLIKDETIVRNKISVKEFIQKIKEILKTSIISIRGPKLAIANATLSPFGLENWKSPKDPIAFCIKRRQGN